MPSPMNRITFFGTVLGGGLAWPVGLPPALR
jgi:hypothetical protein